MVIGSNEENVSANTYIINRNNVDKINVCGQLCPDCQQREIYEQNMNKVKIVYRNNIYQNILKNTCKTTPEKWRK